jgi:hypothetical protein
MATKRVRRPVSSQTFQAERHDSYALAAARSHQLPLASTRVFCNRFDGIVREEAVWWTLSQGAARLIVCRMFTHPLGHELRLELNGQLQNAQVCRIDDEIVDRQESWRATLEAQGWTRA